MLYKFSSVDAFVYNEALHVFGVGGKALFLAYFPCLGKLELHGVG
jgi:hypothetical protein